MLFLQSGVIGALDNAPLEADQHVLSVAWDRQMRDGARNEYVLSTPTPSLTRGQYPERLVVESEMVGRGLDARRRGAMRMIVPSTDDSSGTTVYGTRRPAIMSVNYDFPSYFIDPACGIWLPRFLFGGLLDAKPALHDVCTASLDEVTYLYAWFAGQR